MSESQLHPFEHLEKARRRSRAWMILPVLGIGLLAASLVVLWWEPPQKQSVSEVTRQFRDIAMAKSPKPGLDDGGPIGPWWVTATDVDPVTGVFLNVHVRSGSMLIAADTARLVIDPATDTFQLELHDVVFTRVPDGDNPELKHHVLELDHHTLGPVPYGMDIVPDQNIVPTTITSAARSIDATR